MYPFPERPAYGAFVSHQVQQLRQFGHYVDVVNILGFRSKLNYLKGAVSTLQKTSRNAYDIVHAHYGLSAFPACCRFRSPLVVTLHGGDVLGPTVQGRLSRFICRFADAVIVVSEEIRKRIPGIVIPCGVDLTVFKPYDRAEARSRLRLPKHKYLVLFPFNPARRTKRYDLALAAVEQLKREHLDAELLAVSNLPNDQMPWCYSAADAMILCSDWEGSPTSVKEALACNLPVVATDVGDMREILNGVEGSRICRQDVSEIARCLREAMTVSRHGRFDGRKAVARYEQSRTVQRIINVYEDVLLRRERK
jgi:glycosyltransferase involved in cell wall biosynthesis